MNRTFTGRMIKRDSKLVLTEASQILFDEFQKQVAEGDSVDILLEINDDNATNLQKAKIHILIRTIASEIGYTVPELKSEIKRRCGLVMGDTLKSFGDCSKEELTLVLQDLKNLCNGLNLPFD
jgi:hypothetical protein